MRKLRLRWAVVGSARAERQGMEAQARGRGGGGGGGVGFLMAWADEEP